MDMRLAITIFFYEKSWSRHDLFYRFIFLLKFYEIRIFIMLIIKTNTQHYVAVSSQSCQIANELDLLKNQTQITWHIVITDKHL